MIGTNNLWTKCNGYWILMNSEMKSYFLKYEKLENCSNR